MNAEIVVTGSEMLLGDLVDTNSVMMAKMLRDIGVNLYYKTTVGDNRSRTAEVLSIAMKRSDVVLTSGGLGPTVDDVTREAVADATGRPLVFYQELWDQITNRFLRYGRPPSENNRRQAYAPEGSILIENRIGTAPVFIVETDTCAVISLPGVPRELQMLMETQVVPYLKRRLGERSVILSKVLRTCAVGESRIDAVIGDLMVGINPTVGLLAHAGEVDVRITAKSESREQAEALIASVETELRGRLGAVIFGEDDQTLDEVIDGLLANRRETLAIVDTATSGQIEQMLVTSSRNGHLISYVSYPDTDAAKRDLGISERERTFSAEDVAGRVAALARRRAGATLGVAVWGTVSAPDEIGDQRVDADVALAQDVVVACKHFGFRNQSGVAQRWLSIRALDRVRRYLIGTPETSAGGIDD